MVLFISSLETMADGGSCVDLTWGVAVRERERMDGWVMWVGVVGLGWRRGAVLEVLCESNIPRYWLGLKRYAQTSTTWRQMQSA